MLLLQILKFVFLHKNHFQQLHLEKVMGFGLLVCLIYGHQQPSVAKGLIRLHHWSSISSLKFSQTELYSKRWTYTSSTSLSVYLLFWNHNQIRSQKWQKIYIFYYFQIHRTGKSIGKWNQFFFPHTWMQLHFEVRVTFTTMFKLSLSL